jgi:PKD repeat protein
MKNSFSLWAIIVTVTMVSFVNMYSFEMNANKQKFSTESNAVFIENKGQWPDEVKLLAKTKNLNIWITDNGLVYDYYRAENKNSADETQVGLSKINLPETVFNGHVVRTSYISDIKGSPAKIISYSKKYLPEDSHSGYFNYIIGSNPSKWITNVRVFDEVIVKNVFPGIDAKYYFETKNGEKQFRYDFIVNPGADPSEIKILTDMGNDRSYFAFLNSENNLVFKTVLGDLVQQKPFSYQTEDIKTLTVESKFELNSNCILSFKVGNYNKLKPLFIDPLVYSTFIGGNYYDSPNSIAVDKSGNVYICGSTYSSDFPKTTGAYGSKKGYYDCFVSKLNSSGSSLVFSSLIGGSDYDYATGIVIDESGNSYITGNTYSSDFPVTKKIYDSTFNGNSDCFVAKIGPNGAALRYSTFFGGGGNDYATALEVDTSGNTYVTGYTTSYDYKTTENACFTSYSGSDDGFFSKFDANGSNLLYSTFFGGATEEYPNSIIIDQSGIAYIAGYTNSANFPTTSAAYSRNLSGSNDCFILKINPNSPTLVFSTFIGGSMDDRATSVAIDSLKNVYITGYTYSYDYPTSSPAVSNYSSGNFDCFATKLDSYASSIIYSTYIGGSNHDYGTCIKVNSLGNAFIAGNTYSTDFITTTNGIDVYQNGTIDGFIVKLNYSGSTLAFSSYFGGINDDYINSIALVGTNNIYLTGTTYSPDFPIISGSYCSTISSYSDGFISKISDISTPIITGRPYYYSYCAGSLISVFYSTDELNINPNTIFYGQLSDSTGSFAKPTVLGSLTSVPSGYIYGVIPINTALGYQYRVRVVSSNPDAIGNNNGYDLAIYNIPAKPTITKKGKDLVSSADAGNQWYFGGQLIPGATEKTYTPINSGIYSVLTLQNACYSLMSEFYSFLLDSDKLTADFSASPRTGVAPIDVTFKDLSLGKPTSWLWEFGDNQTSTEKNPIHKYTKAGSFNVKLTISNGVSNDTKTNFSCINVSDSDNLIAGFIADPTSGEAPLTVQFSDNSAGAPVGWIWDFGDGKVSTEANPTHVYENMGNYNVTLKAMKGPYSDISTKENFINVTTKVNVKDSDIESEYISVFPSPNIGNFLLNINNVSDQVADLIIYNETGQQVYKEKLTIANGSISKEFNLKIIQSGACILKLFLKDREISKKIVIEK